ncbi:MAG: hypothetical protein HC857_03245 [Synechococcales cyanobacterium RU_4_20]|nr:hypothetical protein [Synechococcales cyanobacterium RU_4_20]
MTGAGDQRCTQDTAEYTAQQRPHYKPTCKIVAVAHHVSPLWHSLFKFITGALRNARLEKCAYEREASGAKGAIARIA